MTYPFICLKIVSLPKAGIRPYDRPKLSFRESGKRRSIMDFRLVLRTRTLTELRMRNFSLPDDVLSKDMHDCRGWEQRLQEWLLHEGFTRSVIKPFQLPCCSTVYPNSVSELKKHRENSLAHTEETARYFLEFTVPIPWGCDSSEKRLASFRKVMARFAQPYLGLGEFSTSWAGPSTLQLASVLFDKFKLVAPVNSFIAGTVYSSFCVNPLTGVYHGYDFVRQTDDGHPTLSMRWNEPRDLPAAWGKFQDYAENFYVACVVSDKAEHAASRIASGELYIAMSDLKAAAGLVEQVRVLRQST